jgi:putative ATPase
MPFWSLAAARGLARYLAMEDLFPEELEKPTRPDAPLATRMRPRTLGEVVGQSHILGPGKLLRRAIEADRISSIILYGPPGVGKTSLAQVIAASTQSRFERLSGVEGSVADIRRVVAQAANRLQNTGQKTILFIDEIHRFNKAQQDVLLPDVESGLLRLIGATTHNPFFYVNSPLVSRSQIFQLEPLSTEDLLTLIRQALMDKERGLGGLGLRVDDEAAAHLAKVSDGDARKCLNALEIAARTTPPDQSGLVHIKLSAAEESIQRKAVVYDADGDAHYDTISAFIKSLRGSDPDAALYWLAKMLYAGEDIRFIARRLIICASEDVGMADSNALVVAVAAQQAVEFVGLPEAQLVLAHATVYVATAPKSNRCTVAIGKAAAEVREGRTLAIPKHLRDTHYKAAKKLGHGQGYKYSHDYEGAYVPQAYLPEGRLYYEPSENGMEKRVKERLDYWRKLFEEEQRKVSAKSKGEK